MDNKDVEMEDAKKRDSENDIRETDDKVTDFKIELKKDEPPYAVTVAEDANQSENGDDSSNKLSNMREMESQTNCVDETNEPVSVEGVEQTGDKIDAESKDEGGISIGADAEVLAASDSIVDEITGLKNGVVKESDANDGLKEEVPVGNDDESEIPVNNVEGNSSCNVAVEKPIESMDTEDCVVNVAQIETAGENVAKSETADENVNSGGESSENNRFQSGLSSNEAPQVQSVPSVEVPQSGDKEAEYAANANEDKVVNDELKQHGNEEVLAGPVTDGNTKSVETVTRHEGNDSSIPNTHEVATPSSIDRYMPTNMGSHSREADKTFCSQATLVMKITKVCFKKENKSF